MENGVLLVAAGSDARPSRVPTSIRPASYGGHHAEPSTLELSLIHRDLALHMDASYVANRGHLRRLVTTFRGSSLLLLVEIGLWIVDLMAKG